MKRPVLKTFSALIAASLVVAGCSSGSGDGSAVSLQDDFSDLQVVGEDDNSGVDISSKILDSSPIAVVSEDDDAAEALAGSSAVALRSPMFVVPETGESDIGGELARLGVGKVLRVGDVDVPDGEWDVVDAPTERTGLEKQIGVEFTDTKEIKPDRLDDMLATTDPASPVLFSLVDHDPVDGPAEASEDTLSPLAKAEPGDDAPTLLSSGDTSLSSTLTGKSTGAKFVHLPGPDPRVNGDSVSAVKREGSVVALGEGWGDDDEFAKKVDKARTETELPGGGQLVFPGHRFVAAYGSPGVPALGILGEQDDAASVQRVKDLAAEYQPFAQQGIIPTFEVITTIASGSPGPDGKYTIARPAEEVRATVDAITDAGGYALIDLQPGRADFLEQAKLYEDLLSEPGVGLALDPEWRLDDGMLPAQEVGHVGVDEVNRVSEWLADLTADKELPQKMFVVHQFQLQMIRDRERMDTTRDELAYVIHADGHGPPEDKTLTWEAMKKDLPGNVHLAWKNFYDEDTPMFTPEQTMSMEPKPWLVTFQ